MYDWVWPCLIIGIHVHVVCAFLILPHIKVLMGEVNGPVFDCQWLPSFFHCLFQPYSYTYTYNLAVTCSLYISTCMWFSPTKEFVYIAEYCYG